MTFASYADFHDSLNIDCPPESKERPALMAFTPDETMPDTLYYQVRLGTGLANGPLRTVKKLGTKSQIITYKYVLILTSL